jgi:hypothetical protein
LLSKFSLPVLAARAAIAHSEKISQLNRSNLLRDELTRDTARVLKQSN